MGIDAAGDLDRITHASSPPQLNFWEAVAEVVKTFGSPALQPKFLANFATRNEASQPKFLASSATRN